MAKGEYSIQISAKVDNLGDVKKLEKSLSDLGVRVKKANTETKGLSVQFLAFGTTLVSTATSVAFIGAALEKAMFRSGLAIQRAGADAEMLAQSLQEAGRSAAELLPVGAAFAQIGFAGKDLDEVSEIAHQFSRVMGMSAKEAAASLTDIAAKAGYQTVPEIRRLGSVLDATAKMFPNFAKGATDTARALAGTAAEAEVTPASVLAASVAFQRAGISAGDAQAAIGNMLETMRYGPEQFASLATVMGLPADQFEKFAAMKPEDQFREFFNVMRDGGMVTRENVPMLMDYLGVSREGADAMVRMAKSGADVNEIFSSLGLEFEKGTFLQKDFTEWTKTLYGALDQLWQTLRGLAEDTAPWLAASLTFVVDVLRWLVKIVGIIPAPIRALAVAFVGLSGVVMLTSKFIKSGLIKDFKAASESVLWFSKKVLMASKVLLVNLWAGLKSAATAMWSYIAATAKAIWQKGVYIASLMAEKLEIAFVTAERWLWIAAMKAENIITGIATGIRAAYTKVVQAEIWTTIALTAEKWLLFAAQTAVNIATGIGTGAMWLASAAGGVLTVVTGALTAGFSALATAIWAALAPLLPFIAIGALVVAAAVAIGYALYKVVQFIANNWTPIWNGITSIALGFWDALKAGWGVIVSVSTAIWDGLISGLKAGWDVIVSVSTAIWDGLIGGLKMLWGWLVAAGKAIAAPFVWLYDKIVAVGDAIKGVVDWLFGSSLFHLKEGVSEVMPALTKMEDAFTGVGRAAGRIGLESHIPDDIRVRVAEPSAAAAGRGRTGALSEELDGKQAYGGPAGSGPTGGITAPPANIGAAGAGEGTEASVRVVVPVTVELDGEVIARAVSEHEINTGRERYMNASLEPMRGTGR